MMMTVTSFNPFLFYSEKLQTLFTKAKTQANPALWLYKNDVRTTLFMLEGLTRLHNEAFDEKLFGKWQKRFKKLEDSFGVIDFQLSLEKELKLNKKISKPTVLYFTKQANAGLENCNKRLLEKSWLNDKLKSFDFKLSEFEVLYNEEYLHQLKQTVLDEIEQIHLFLKKIKYTFLHIEEDVHELRRKLRWLGIYANALNGLVQVKKSPKSPKYQLTYFTKDILNSPYNKLPPKPKGTASIEFNRDAFFALSWIINELGKLKDTGLKLHALTEAIFKTEDVTEYQAKEKAILLLALKPTVEKDILKQASELVSAYMVKDKLLDQLVAK